MDFDRGFLLRVMMDVIIDEISKKLVEWIWCKIIGFFSLIILV